MAVIGRPAGPWPKAIWASAAYEFRMQARRPAVWLVLLLVAAATLAATHAPFQMAQVGRGAGTAAQVAGAWATALQVLLPAAFGCLLADRVLREKRLRVDELFGSLPTTPGRLLLGKYLGAVAATALPIACVYGAGALYLTALRGPAFLAAAVAAFALVNLPGLLFVAAFAMGCPVLMPVALFQFLFVGYWFWGHFLPPTPGIPTISHTILTPAGGYAAGAFFHAGGAFGLERVATSSGWASIGVLLCLAALVLWATGGLLARHRFAHEKAAAPRPTRRPRPQRTGSARWQIVRYELRILGRSVLLTPLLIVGVFAFMALLTGIVGAHRQVPRVLTAALEIGLSLGAGIAAANLVAAEPATEMHLALPRGYRVTALSRLGIATLWTCLLGLLLTCLLAATGGLLTGEPFGLSQLTWAAPILWMAAAGALLALLIRSRAGSVGVITGLWLAEFIARGLFRSKPWLHPVELFATSFARGAPWWLANRLELMATAVVVLVACWWLLGNGEAFVGSAQE